MTVEKVTQYYTTQLGAGLGLAEETKILLTLYEPSITVTDLYEHALSSGMFPMVTARRLRNIIAECFSPRYMKTNVAMYLKQLAPVITTQDLNQLFLIHTAQANKVLQDFIIEVYWSRYSGGHDQVTTEDARDFVSHAVREGKRKSHGLTQLLSTYRLILLVVALTTIYCHQVAHLSAPFNLYVFSPLLLSI